MSSSGERGAGGTCNCGGGARELILSIRLLKWLDCGGICVVGDDAAVVVDVGIVGVNVCGVVWSSTAGGGGSTTSVSGGGGGGGSTTGGGGGGVCEPSCASNGGGGTASSCSGGVC